MAFSSWCAVHLGDVSRRLDALLDDLARQRLERERHADVWRTYHAVEAMSPWADWIH